MKNPERTRYPALSQAELRALYEAQPTKVVLRLVWEIYCLQFVVKKASAVDRVRNDQTSPNFPHALLSLHEALEAETYVHENLPSLHRFHIARQDRKWPKQAGSLRRR